MTNREKVEKFLDEPIGCYHPEMDMLDEENLNKVIDGLKYGGDTDVTVCINRKHYVIEIFREGLDEVDFIVSTKTDYKNKYGYE